VAITSLDDASFTYSNTSYCLSENNPIPTITGASGGTFTIDNGGSINSSTGEVNLVQTGVGSYTVTYSTSGTCSNYSTQNITIINQQSAAIISNDTTICINDPLITFIATNIGGVWSGLGITDSIYGIFDPSLAGLGTFTVYYTISGSCGDSDSINVTIKNTPIFNLVVNDESCGNQNGSILVSFVDVNFPIAYNWSNGEVEDSIYNLSAGNYSLTITDSNNCSATEATSITNVDEDCDYFIFIPTVFSPNGDGENDILFLRGKGIEEFSLVIYNRCGNKVFETNDLNVGWDGTYKGQSLNSAVFVYYVKGTYKNGDNLMQKGNISIVK
jgi:gliding motility-associated-like protein